MKMTNNNNNNNNNNEMKEEVTRGLTLSIFLIISTFTVFSSITVIVSNILMIIIEIYYSSVMKIEISNIILRIYTIMIAICIIFIEMEWTDIIRSITIFQSWFLRGAIYNFCGLITFDMKIKFDRKLSTYPVVIDDLSNNNIYIIDKIFQISSICLMLFGLIYIFMVLLL